MSKLQGKCSLDLSVIIPVGCYLLFITCWCY